LQFLILFDRFVLSLLLSVSPYLLTRAALSTRYTSELKAGDQVVWQMIYRIVQRTRELDAQLVEPVDALVHVPGRTVQSSMRAVPVTWAVLMGNPTTSQYASSIVGPSVVSFHPKVQSFCFADFYFQI
jgi:hypothetical protein